VFLGLPYSLGGGGELATPGVVGNRRLHPTAAIAAASLVDPGRLVAALRTGGLFLPIAAYVITVAWVGAARGTVRFDEIGTQVIAVLALATSDSGRRWSTSK
jgi:hypothetical protein